MNWFRVHAVVITGAALVVAAGSPVGAQLPLSTEELQPEPIRISVSDLPEPYASESAQQSPQVIPVPDQPTLQAPAGFVCQVFADNVDQARWLAKTPDGHILCSSGKTDTIYLLQDTDKDGLADQRHVFLDQQRGANLPFGMDFAEIDGQWYFYLGNTDGVLRYPYQPGQTSLKADFEKITELPGQGYHQHWTRNVRVAPSGQQLFVTVGSKSNVDIEDPPRATVLKMNLDGSDRQVFASGLRNPVGLDFEPETGDVYVNVNERDGLGDDLVPDYLTRVQQDQFYGWPYAYLKPELVDPRHAENGRSERPDLVQQTQLPDVLYQAHSAALGLAFATENHFPEPYRRGAFAAFRGSWNRSRGTGYKIVFVPFGSDHRPLGYYQDFVTGFLIDPQGPTTWGRPVGVVFAEDGSLLFTEEANGRIYRVAWQGDN